MDSDDWWPGERVSCEVDDVPLMQPVGFVWFSKPRYRIKAKSVRRQHGDLFGLVLGQVPQ